MTQKPLLIFPSPAAVSPSSRPPGRGKLHYPSVEQQTGRLTARISNLERVFANHTASIHTSVEGLVPEMVLVLEIAGRIDDFFRAVEKTPGMEFLLEYQDEFTDPDEFFYEIAKDGEASEKVIENRIFLSMTNAEAIRELQRYWEKYQQGDEYERGTTRFRTLFQQLKDIRPYSIQDRLKDTGFSSYLEEIRNYEGETVHFEIEFAFREHAGQNDRAFAEVEVLLRRAGGQVIPESRTLIPAINYHGCVALAPIESFHDLTENTNVEFLKAYQILFFRPVGQSISVVELEEAEEEEEASQEGLSRSPEQDLRQPVVALFDGFPLANHRRLNGRLEIDDPDGFEENYLVRGRIHGTSMASLILHGDLDHPNEAPLGCRLYVRPIMRGASFGSNFVEELPRDRLLIDLVHRAVRRMKVGDAETGPTAAEVRIINFSIGDHYRPFHFNLSSWARLFDWLSVEYDVLFIVSTGNYAEHLVVDLPLSEFNQLPEDGQQKLVLKAILRENYRRKILSPGESVNALSVGACHLDHSSGNQYPHSRSDFIKTPDLLSYYSRIGFGYGKAVKPEILMAGGRKLFRNPPIQPTSEKSTFHLEKPPSNVHPPGNKVALPGKAGELTNEAYTCGTSNAAALTSRLGARIIDVLENLNLTLPNEQIIPTHFFTVLTKALLVHGASWGDARSILEDILRERRDIASNNRKSHIAALLGYGRVNGERVLYCTDQRVTLLGFGEIRKDQAHEFRFPLPDSLAGKVFRKRLTITLAWFSPLNFKTSAYRKAVLYFDNAQSSQDLIRLNREEYDYDISRRGTVQHDCLIGTKADPYIQGSELIIKVNCKQGASGLSTAERIKYGLAVTLDVAEAANFSIYEEVRARIQQRVQVQ